MDKPMAASFRAGCKDETSLIYHDQDKKEIRAIFNTVQEAIEAKQKLENKKVSYAIHYTEDITELASGSGHSKPEELLENPPQDDLLTNSILRIVNLHLTRQQLYEDDELEKLTMLENLIVRYTVGICYNTKTWEELTTRLRPFELTADTNTLIKQLRIYLKKTDNELLTSRLNIRLINCFWHGFCQRLQTLRIEVRLIAEHNAELLEKHL